MGDEGTSTIKKVVKTPKKAAPSPAILTDEERTEIEQVYDGWCKTSESPLSKEPVGLSYRNLKAHCHGIDPYTLGTWLHQYSNDEGKRLSKEEFVSMVAEFYKAPNRKDQAPIGQH